MGLFSIYKNKVKRVYPQAYASREYSMFGKPKEVTIWNCGEHGIPLGEMPQVLGSAFITLLAWKDAWNNIKKVNNMKARLVLIILLFISTGLFSQIHTVETGTQIIPKIQLQRDTIYTQITYDIFDCKNYSFVCDGYVVQETKKWWDENGHHSKSRNYYYRSNDGYDLGKSLNIEIIDIKLINKKQ